MAARLKNLFFKRKIRTSLSNQRRRHEFNNNLNKTALEGTKIIAHQKNNYIPKNDAPIPGFCCIGITDYCFFKCKMCDKWKEDIKVKEKLFPTLNEWKKFIFELSHVVKDRLSGDFNERFELNFAGGESLTNTHTLELVKFASSLGFRTVIPSNGYIINESMAKKLNKAGLTGLNLSLDSLNSKTHDKFRGFKGAYDGVMKAIESTSKYRYPEVGIIGIIHDSTYRGIPDLVKWVLDHKKLEWILIMAIMQPNNTIFNSGWYERNNYSYLWPKNIESATKTVDELIELKNHTISLQKKGLTKRDKIINTLPQLNAFKNYFKYPEKFVKNEMPCNFDTAVQVSAVGDIHMCYQYEMLGNVKNTSFIDAWDSMYSKNIRNKIKICKTNCHELINCYYKEEYPFKVIGN